MTLDEPREGHLEELTLFSDSVLAKVEGLDVSPYADDGTT